MKTELGWRFPDHEKHLLGLMQHPKHRMMLNGRIAYQGHKYLAALELCKHRRVAIDVGGHIGLWSFNLTHDFKYVHAFEPVAEHCECFRANLDGIDNITLHEMALGSEIGYVGMSTESGSSGNTVVSGVGSIPMTTLDSFGCASVDLIKIDCEGYEEIVLRGAMNTLRENKPVVIVEQKRDMAQRFDLPIKGAVRFLEERGYRQAREISGDYIMVPA